MTPGWHYLGVGDEGGTAGSETHLVVDFSALEVIGEQEKVLQDTRDVFDRTTAFFLLDKQQVGGV